MYTLKVKYFLPSFWLLTLFDQIIVRKDSILEGMSFYEIVWSSQSNWWAKKIISKIRFSLKILKSKRKIEIKTLYTEHVQELIHFFTVHRTVFVSASRCTCAAGDVWRPLCGSPVGGWGWSSILTDILLYAPFHCSPPAQLKRHAGKKNIWNTQMSMRRWSLNLNEAKRRHKCWYYDNGMDDTCAQLWFIIIPLR